MEAAGLAVGAVGLAGLFSICTECFELVQRGRYFGRDYHLLETQFANQRMRLLAWGRACRLNDTDNYDKQLRQDEDLAKCLESTLLHLVHLLQDGENLRHKYGLRAEDQSVTLASTSISPWAITRHSVRSALGQGLVQLGRKINVTQREATIGAKARWAIEHKDKFGTLVQDVRILIDDLENLIAGTGLHERQKQMVQMEVDSIRDMQMLESTEEAGIGRLDAISDVASLRLCYIRGQFGPLGDRASSPSRSERETHSPAVQDEWEFIAEIPPIPSTGDARLQYLDLHRVHCEISTTAIFLEEPNYGTRQNTDSQWVVIDEHRPSKEPRSLHLCGKTPIDLEFFLAQNTQLDFVVFYDYQCTHNTVRDESLDCQSMGQSARVVSAELFSALQELPAIVGRQPVLQLNAETPFPYYWFYHVRGALDSHIQAHYESDTPVLGKFLEFLRQSTALEYARIDSQLSRGVISWKYIRYLFKVGDVVVEERPKGTGQYQAYRIEKEPHTTGVSLGLRLGVYRIEKGLSDLKVRTTLNLQRENSSSPEKELKISSLDVIPLQYAGEMDEDSLVSRGMQLLSCFPNRLVSYTGPVVDYMDDISGDRWMVDTLLYEELYGTVMGDDTYERVHLLSADWEQDTLLLQPTVHRFNLKTHTWHELLVMNTHEVMWDKSLFDRILVPDREYLHSHVTSPVLRASDEAPLSLSLLFHGDSGSSKPLAAQAVGELVERPLYHITPRNMGSTVNELAQAISAAIRLATTWKCVIFLKDVGDLLNREHSLAEFVRLLGTFKGIIILTFSDGTTPLTEALSSRIPISVRLPQLSEQQSRMLWENGIRQLQRMGFNVDPKLLHGSTMSFFERGLSCRDIQNALSNVEKLAIFNPQEINMKMVERVMSYKLS